MPVKREIAALTSTTGTGMAELPHCDNQQPTSGFQVALRYTTAPCFLQGRNRSASVPLMRWKIRALESTGKVGTIGATKKFTATRSTTREAPGRITCHDHHRKPILVCLPLHAEGRLTTPTSPRLHHLHQTLPGAWSLAISRCLCGRDHIKLTPLASWLPDAQLRSLPHTSTVPSPQDAEQAEAYLQTGALKTTAESTNCDFRVKPRTL